MSEDYNTATPVALSSPEVAPSTLPFSALLESLLFVADGPVPIAHFAQALDSTPRAIEAALEELESHYHQRGLRIQRDKSGIQLTTAPQAAAAVEKYLGLESLQRLSKPAVETLAIIAYQQPVTRPYIESIRGVNSDGVIKSLLTKGLIEEVGRTEGPGRPVLYATTPTFLQHFGLAALAELPPLDIESLLVAAKVTAEQNLQASPESESVSPPPTDAGSDLAATPQPNEVEDQTATVSEPADVAPVSDESLSTTSVSEPDLAITGDSVTDSQPDLTPESESVSDDDDDDEEDEDDDWEDDDDEEDDDED